MLTLIAVLFLGINIQAHSQKVDTLVYKTIDTVKLMMEVHYPEGFSKESDTAYPAMIYFFGGGWNGGTIGQFRPHAEYFSKRGLVCFLAQYRIRNRHKTSPFESLKDAKSAMRYLKIHASELGIDSSRIIGSGGSAGGHLAAATALAIDFDDPDDDLTIDPAPQALVLFNPVIDNGPGGYGFERVGSAYKNFSPLHNIRKGAPPTIIFLGTQDPLIPVETVQYYQRIMKRVGSDCEVNLYQGQNHGFFNKGKSPYFEKTVLAADEFLIKLGFLQGKPTMVVPD